MSEPPKKIPSIEPPARYSCTKGHEYFTTVKNANDSHCTTCDVVENETSAKFRQRINGIFKKQFSNVSPGWIDPYKRKQLKYKYFCSKLRIAIDIGNIKKKIRLKKEYAAEQERFLYLYIAAEYIDRLDLYYDKIKGHLDILLKERIIVDEMHRGILAAIKDSAPALPFGMTQNTINKIFIDAETEKLIVKNCKISTICKLK